MTEREVFKKYGNLSENELNSKKTFLSAMML